MRALLAAAPIDLPRLQEVHLDAQVLLFALAISLLTGLIFGALPALRTLRSAPVEALKSGGRGNTDGRGGLRVRNVLVTLEVGLSAALLVTAGLLIASFVRLMNVDRGFQVDRVLAMDLSLLSTRYPNPPERAAFFQRVLEKAAAMPGVRNASMVSALPLMGETWIDIVGLEHDTRPMVELPSTNVRFISPGYFQTLAVGLRDGRDFEEQDRSRKVAIVSASLAQRLWGRENPVGRKMTSNDTVVEVVGVTPDFRSTSLDKEPVNMLYIPYWQRPRLSASLLVRTSMDPRGIASALRAAVWEIDGEVTVPEVRTLEEVLSRSVAQRRFQMLLVVLFALAALALAAFGTYGVLSYAVTRRTGEMGIRMALGAQRSDVLGMVLRQGMMPVLAGLAAGALVRRRARALSGEPALPGQPARSAGLRRLGRRPAARLRGRLPDPRAPRHPRQPHRSPPLRMTPVQVISMPFRAAIVTHRGRAGCLLSSRTSSSRTSSPPAWTTSSTGRANRPSGRSPSVWPAAPSR